MKLYSRRIILPRIYTICSLFMLDLTGTTSRSCELTKTHTHTHGGFWNICEHYFEVILNTLFKYTKYLQSVLFWCNFLRTFCTTATTRCPLVEKIQSAWAFARIFGFVDYRTTHTYTYIRVFAWLALEAFSSELLLVLAPLLLGSPCWGLCWHLRTSWLYFNNSCNS